MGHTDTRSPQQDALRTKHHLCGILAKNTKPHANREKTSDKPKLKDIVQITSTLQKD